MQKDTVASNSGEKPDDITKTFTVLTREEVDQLHEQMFYFTTSDNVKLGVHEYGDPKGHPILFYHGTGAHIHPMLLHKPGQDLGFRIIVPTRPGISDSSFTKWTHMSYAGYMEELADHLKLDKFAIMGISGGGPTLMASARHMPQRLTCVCALACASPLYGDPVMQKQIGFTDRIYAKLANHMPLWEFEVMYSFVGLSQKLLKSPKTFTKMFSGSLCEADNRLFAHEDFQYMFMRDMQESFKHGTKGPSYDAQRIVQTWDFNVEDITAHIDVFQGEDDLFVPMVFAKYYETKLKDVAFHVIPKEGHFYHVAYGYDTLSKVKQMYYS